MNRLSVQTGVRAKQNRGMTLVEVMVAVAICSIVLGAACSLWFFGNRSFVAMGNYTDLDARSRNALDQMSRDIRQATQVTAFYRGTAAKWFTVTNTTRGTGATYIWQAATRTLACRQPGQPDQVFLTECDRWDFEFFQRAPQTTGTYSFFRATDASGHDDLSICKLINMSWQCSRSVLGKMENTEFVHTAQVVLRNKQ